ncbi:hypothetical protein [Streptomyces flaveolus]|uniref:hypothetical protein n=1 Tax=Streptomyces flaveolus TaxID=67297 RepID=UPI001670D19C|nr:hypothetical protein [Streptomyces flaveolus]
MDDEVQKSRDDMELYTLLGLMVRSAAELELRLQLIAINLSESHYAHLWIHGASGGQATKLIRELAKANPVVTEASQAEITDLMKEIDAALTRRHGYVHGAWLVDPLAETYQAMRFTKGNTSPRFDPMSKEDLSDLTHTLARLLEGVTDWLVKHVSVNGSQFEN